MDCALQAFGANGTLEPIALPTSHCDMMFEAQFTCDKMQFQPYSNIAMQTQCVSIVWKLPCPTCFVPQLSAPDRMTFSIAAMATIITRKHPKSGKVERPYRDKQGNFVLGDPTFGNQLHLRKNAVLTTDYAEALRLVRMGFSIRMSAGDSSPPSLISAGKLTLTDVDEVAEGDIPAEGPQTPFPLETVLRDLQKALVVEAIRVAHWSSYEAAKAFLGFPTSDDASELYNDTDPAEVDLSRFRATPLINASYDWAFQIGKPEAFRLETRDDLRSLMYGASADTISTMPPIGNLESALGVTVATAIARWKFEFETSLPLSVRELAYLAQMKEVAARNALAKAGVKGRGGVDNAIARQWLSERQKFVPTRPDLLSAAP